MLPGNETDGETISTGCVTSHTPIETINDFLVGRNKSGQFVMVNPPRGPFTREQALRLAAYLIIMSNDEYDMSPPTDMLSIGQVMDAIANV